MREGATAFLQQKLKEIEWDERTMLGNSLLLMRHKKEEKNTEEIE